MIIKVFLALFFSALLLLLTGVLLDWLDLTFLAAIVLALGDNILLFSFALFLASGLVFISQQIIAALSGYFSPLHQARRKLLFSLAQIGYLQRLSASKKKQLYYFAERKRKRLLAKDNQKQQQIIIAALQTELNSIKNKLSIAEFESYQQQINHLNHQPEITRLLELQRKISALH